MRAPLVRGGRLEVIRIAGDGTNNRDGSGAGYREEGFEGRGSGLEPVDLKARHRPRR